VTDSEYNDWLASPDAMRVILIEAVCNRAGSDVVNYLATLPYASLPGDTPPNTPYLDAIRGGLEYSARIRLDGGSEISFGDIQIENRDGSLDFWRNDVWAGKPVIAVLGDARWGRNDFRIIFSGEGESLESVDGRETFNLRIRNKLARLDMPISEAKIGGSGPNKEALMPVSFGEQHNVTPVLFDPNTLTYAWHAGFGEGLIEVRDGGVPLKNDGSEYTVNLNSTPARASLAVQPYNDITFSVQGDNTGGYVNTCAQLISRIVKNWGTEPQKRFTDADIDLNNFAAFDVANPQPLGAYFTDSPSVFDVCDGFAQSVGARLTQTIDGRLRLVKIQLPPSGTPKTVTEADMLAGSLEIEETLPVVAACKIAFCKNWTVQEGLTGLIPEEHKRLFGEEWLTTLQSDATVSAKYGLPTEVEPENTFLLRRIDAQAEALRRLILRRTQRTVFSFIGFADLIFTELGSPMILQHWRFGNANGRLGQVVSVAVDWINARIRIGVLI
jgi:hypothetical protein